MIWFNEVKSVEVNESNIEKVARWMRAKVLYLSPNDEPFIELKTARGYIMVRIGDEVQMNGNNYVFVTRKKSELQIDGFMPAPKHHVRESITKDHSGNDRVRFGGER